MSPPEAASAPLPMQVEPVTLEGRRVRMEPLSLDRHFAGLLAIGLDLDLWRWTLNVVKSESDLRDYLEVALADQSQGKALPFATVDRASGTIAGCTRFGNIETRHRKVEIGWTWVGRAFQRTHVNTEAKYLMLAHAFETWGCVRVELKTNALNRRSRTAMLRIGCVEEGILRRHMINDSGSPRDTVYYSVIAEEWPAVKRRLERMMPAGG